MPSVNRSVTAFERHSQFVPAEDHGVSSHTLAEGETLSLLADRYYDDWRLWLDIATYNEVADPRRIPTGTRLLIPPRRLEDGRFQSE